MILLNYEFFIFSVQFLLFLVRFEYFRIKYHKPSIYKNKHINSILTTLSHQSRPNSSPLSSLTKKPTFFSTLIFPLPLLPTTHIPITPIVFSPPPFLPLLTPQLAQFFSHQTWNLQSLLFPTTIPFLIPVRLGFNNYKTFIRPNLCLLGNVLKFKVHKISLLL